MWIFLSCLFLLIGISFSFFKYKSDEVLYDNKFFYYENFLDVLSFHFSKSISLTYLGSQGFDSIFIQLQLDKTKNKIYRIKQRDNIIRFDMVIGNAWYKNSQIGDYHVNKITSIDLKKYENKSFFESLYKSLNLPIRNKINISNKLEKKVSQILSKFVKLSNDYSKLSNGDKVKNPIHEDDVFNFVKEYRNGELFNRYKN